MALNTTPRTWAIGEVATAAHMNTEVRDGFTGIQAAWTTYTPTLTNITLGNGALDAAYMRIGHLVFVRFRFLAGSTTSYSAGTLAFSAPVTPNAVYTGSVSCGVGAGLIKPATSQSVTVFFDTNGKFNLYTDAAASGGTVTNTNPGTFVASTSSITFTATYEAA